MPLPGAPAPLRIPSLSTRFRGLCSVCCSLGDGGVGDGVAGASPNSPEWVAEPQVSFLTQSLTGAPKQVGQQAWGTPASQAKRRERRVAGQQAGPGRGVGDKGEPGTIPALCSLQGAGEGGPTPLAGSSLGLLHTAAPPAASNPLRSDWPEQAAAQPGCS